MKPINLCFPTLSNYEGLGNAIESACNGSVRPTQIIVMDNGQRFKELFGEVNEVNGTTITIVTPVSNLGVAGSWNYFLNNYYDHIIISNDDVIFNSETLRLLVEASISNPEELFICPNAYWQHKWSLFLQKKISLDILGQYDENFMPCYFEDCCMEYRMKLKGYKPLIVNNCTYDHIDGGSKTSQHSVNNQQFQKMLEYYMKKWGGIPRCETFITPFNQ